MVCGDTMEAFRTDSGLWCLLLADGMGSGDAARRESSLTCRLLRQFLEADIQPEAALTTLNSAMALRGAETGSFTTVDLCVLKGSEATFYKFGAAPSYLKKNGAVRRITGSSLPVGLRGTPAAPDITTVTLEPASRFWSHSSRLGSATPSLIITAKLPGSSGAVVTSGAAGVPRSPTGRLLPLIRRTAPFFFR